MDLMAWQTMMLCKQYSAIRTDEDHTAVFCLTLDIAHPINCPASQPVKPKNGIGTVSAEGFGAKYLADRNKSPQGASRTGADRTFVPQPLRQGRDRPKHKAT
ncbi:hypothetical protein PY365_13175 [Roseiarcaceae bacterium H3SJ34-1]|uniref:hypothetical protein n=1 Tax=Terripilifer ovatus TaxID=3032367 RepID=UPI003AB9A63C|nr:hypothetical protein [Roseiarcaceae bacterium H3SJ34-1]